MKHALLVTLVLLFVPAAACAADEERPWNFVFLLVDDLGWTDLGCFGSDLYETPNIDRLAASGVKFTNAYAACTVCSPTRAAVLTGRYPARLHVTDFIAGHPFRNTPLSIPEWTKYLPHEEVTMAEALRPAGYRTVHLGKWHLTPRDGMYHPEYWPETQGFQLNIGGFQAGAPGDYFWPYQRGRNEGLSRVINLPRVGQDGDYLTDVLTDLAVGQMERWRDEPFLMYFAYYTVHTPLIGKPELVDRFRAKITDDHRHNNPVYAAMVHSLDQSVGRILDTLERLQIADRTVIVFTSDNGGLLNNPGNPTRVTSNLPLRNGKGSVYEGGVRVPAVIRWPGVTPPGAVCEEPIISIDYFPTILEIAGVSADDAGVKEIDGLSLTPLLRDPSGRLDRDAIYWHYPHYHMCGGVPYSAVRERDWKLIEFHEDQRLELYQLADDVHEDRNLAAEFPDRAAGMQQRLHAWRESVGAQLPTANPDYDAARPFGVPRRGGIRAPEPVRRD